MKMKTCPNGHSYDADKHPQLCPHCINPGVETVKAVFAPEAPQDAHPQRRLPSSDEEKTIAIAPSKDGKVIDPIVGWLVCIDGPQIGRDYRIHAFRNFIGRGDRMDIVLKGDLSVQREKHAQITYEPLENKYFIGPGDGHMLVYLAPPGNVRAPEHAVHQPEELYEFAKIRVGQTKLLFVPLCGQNSNFQWEGLKAESEPDLPENQQ